MRDDRRNEIKVGLTVLVGIVILITGITSFRECSFTESGNRVQMRFPESSGLLVGDDVTVNGVKCGTVESVTLEGTSVFVTAVMSETLSITEDALPVIQMLELMGGKKIDIRQGKSRQRYRSPSVLVGRVDPDISGALGMLGSFEDELKQMSSNASQLLQRAKKDYPDSMFFRDLRETMRNTRLLTEDARVLLSTLAPDVRSIVLHGEAAVRRADSLFGVVAPRIDTTLRSTETLVQESETLVRDVRSIVNELKEGRGLFHAIVHDRTLVDRIDHMIGRLDTLTTVIIEGQMRIKMRL